MEQIELSIIIPTRNRQYYCKQAVMSVLNVSKDKNIEIVIQDNSDNNSLKKELELLNDSKIKYFYNAGPLSFVDNFKNGYINSRGNYLIYIGDDDTILPSIYKALDYMKLHDIDSLIPSLNCVYFWPNQSSIINNKSGELSLFYVRNKYKRIDAKAAVRKLGDMGCQQYQDLGLARSYHGIVKRSLFMELDKKGISQFDGLSPDIYNAVVMSLIAKNTIRIEYPITISGICPKSGSADSATGKHTGSLANAPHFRGHNDYLWDKKIPHVYSVETIWADSASRAMKNMNDLEDYNNIDLKMLLYFIIKNNKSLEKILNQYRLENNITNTDFLLIKIKESINSIKRKIVKLFVTRKNDRLVKMNIENICEAQKIIMEQLKMKGII